MSNSLNTITVDGITYEASQKTTDTTTTSSDGSTLDKDAFLQLLCTQMEYQDPLDPQDNSEYVAQLAQFSSLEQMTNIASAMTSLSSVVSNIDQSMLVGQLSGMIGKEVQWTNTSTVTDSSGNAVTDSSGNTQTVSQTHTGTVSGVSISDGTPSLIVTATESGSSCTYKVPIGTLTRVGSGGETTTE